MGDMKRYQVVIKLGDYIVASMFLSAADGWQAMQRGKTMAGILIERGLIEVSVREN